MKINSNKALTALEFQAELRAKLDLGKTQQPLTQEQEGAVVRSPKNHRRKVRLYEN